MAIMIIIVVAVTPIIFKKNVATTDFGKESGTFVCSCSGSSATKQCTFNVEKSGTREFYTIQLLGGGAGGGSATTMRGGGAGESKVVYYPSMDGQYIITIGAGGAKGNPGGQTTITKSGTVLEYANGGITTNETAVISSEQIGETPAYSENGCGKGGNSGSSGIAGEVIIRW
jgi:hypothetical protein